MKKALCVGINKYSGENILNGCVNDTLLNVKVWKEIFKFDEIKILTDQQATRQNILLNLKWLTNKAKLGDTLLFSYSGHGTAIPVTDRTRNSELDGVDETIVSVDWDNYHPTPIRDNDLGAYFKDLKGIKILVILDACMSGTGLRGCLPNKTKNRYMALPPDLMLKHSDIDLDEDLNYDLTKLNIKKPENKNTFLVPTIEQGEAILISGCQDHEYSADAYFGNKYFGALTYFLHRSLRDHNYKISYQDLITDINQKLDDAGFTEQTPQLEGHSELFNKNFLE